MIHQPGYIMYALSVTVAEPYASSGMRLSLDGACRAETAVETRGAARHQRSALVLLRRRGDCATGCRPQASAHCAQQRQPSE